MNITRFNYHIERGVPAEKEMTVSIIATYPESKKYDLQKEYDQQFFDHKVLLYIPLQFTSSSIRFKVSRITKKGVIHIYRKTPWICTMDLVMLCAVIELDKKDLLPEYSIHLFAK